MPTVFIGVGSNLGEREKNIRRAKDCLGSVRGIRFLACSQIRETEPVGGPSAQKKYLNAVWQIETELKPRKLLEHFMKIERELGRVRKLKNEPRVIDLDILFYDQDVIDVPHLTIPHPRLHERGFVLEPMAELAPDFIHPQFKKNIKTLLDELHEDH
ncbi:MAG TPA: 2-amino-4-hydroxy-6-hydroxymethyldihydropteridine diphosphokinase [Candidatus Omnitrophota bacterium]|nr:2-amino-4-hydroxy-6-hydroxymethyldihydropteridine diphosphokinase [Candidatus Omnitrophota bacterium]